MMRKAAVFITILSLALFFTKTSLAANPIDGLKPGEWFEVPNSHMRDVAPIDPPGTFACVIYCWSSGAYDTKRNRLIVWGGGHGSYAGNEIYVFDINTLKWTRINDPSPYQPPQVPSPNINPDNTPVSVHTYDGIEYLPNVDKFWTHGGSRWYDGSGHDLTWAFDFNTLAWTQMANSPAGWSASLEQVSTYDPITGHVFIAGPNSNSILMEYNPISNTWTQRGDASGYIGYGQSAALDSKRRKFLAIGKGQVFAFDIKPAGTLTKQTLTTTGATEIINAIYPGLVYDPVSDKFVAWDGGANVYTLDMDTLVWTKVLPAATNTVIPTQSTIEPYQGYKTGTYGRFQYIPSKNAFIVVNSVDENVYIYKLSSGTPPNNLKGDVNSDNAVDVLDVQSLVNHILGIQNYGSRADVNSDSSVDVLDVQEVVNIILGAG